MTARRIKWKTYWNFAKVAKRWPHKPERTIIKSMAEQVVAMITEPATIASSIWGFPIVEDDRLEPDVCVIVKGELPEPVDWDEALNVWDVGDRWHDEL